MKSLITSDSAECLAIARLAGLTDTFISSFKVVINSEEAYVIYTGYPKDGSKRIQFNVKQFKDPRQAADSFTKMFNLPTPLIHFELLAEVGHATTIKIEQYAYIENLNLDIPKLELVEPRQN